MEGKDVSVVEAIREILATSKSADEDDAEDYDDAFAQFLEAQRNKQPPPKPIRVPRQSLPSKEDSRSQPKIEVALQARNRNVGDAILGEFRSCEMAKVLARSGGLTEGTWYIAKRIFQKKDERARKNLNEFNMAFRGLQSKSPTPPDRRHGDGGERMQRQRQLDVRPLSASTTNCSTAASCSRPVEPREQSREGPMQPIPIVAPLQRRAWDKLEKETNSTPEKKALLAT